MRILFIAADLNAFGGSQRYNRHLVEVLRKIGHDVVSVEIKKLGLLDKFLFSFHFFLKTLFFKPDLVVCSNINYSPLGYVAKKILGRNYSVTLYGIQAINIKPLYKFFLKSAHCLITPFKWTATNALRQVPSLKNRTFILPNPLDEEEFFIKDKPDYLIKRHNLKNSKVILTICRLSSSERDNKGYGRVIQALPKVLNSHPNAKYILAGGGDDKLYVENLVKRLKLKDAVILTGPLKQEEMVDYYNVADVFVFPSKIEGFPALVLLEALACGVPIVGGDQPGSDHYPWSEVGLIVKADSVEEIASATINILAGNVSKKILDRYHLRETILELYGEETYKKHLDNFLRFISK